MKLLSKYILTTITRPFIITLILTNGLLLTGYCFQSLELFFAHKSGFLGFLKFIVSKIPENILLTIPISSLVSILFLGTRLITKAELVLVLSSGISKKEIYLPPLFFSLFLSISCLMFSEFLIPQANKSHKLLKEKMQGITVEEKPISIKLSNAFVHIGSLQDNVIKDLKIQREDLIILGELCEYKNNKWELKKGIERKIEKGEVEEEMEVSILKMPFLKPDEIRAIANPDYEALRPSMLFKAIGIAKKYGIENKNYIKELHFKIAFSFSSLILGMIGLGIITRGLKLRLYGNIGIALLISFIYWEAMLFFKSLNISPIFASWAGNIIGISIALRLLR